MTAQAPENKIEEPKIQEKIDTNQVQPAIDAKQEVKPKEEEPKEDPNWKAFREARKQDRALREAAEKRAAEKEAEAQALKAAMEAAFSKQQYVNPQYAQQYPEEETEDQRIEKKVQAAIAAREAEFERQRQIREQQEFPMRLRQNFPDFNSVVTEENLEYLEYHHPEIARTLMRLPDGYEKYEDMYKLVKKFIPNTNGKKDSMKADINYNKPKSISSTGLTQTGDTITSARLSEERKAANWERMQRQLKGLS